MVSPRGSVPPRNARSKGHAKSPSTRKRLKRLEFSTRGKAAAGVRASRYRALGVDLGTPSLRTADGSVMTAKIAARAKQPEEDETGSGD